MQENLISFLGDPPLSRRSYIRLVVRLSLVSVLATKGWSKVVNLIV